MNLKSKNVSKKNTIILCAAIILINVRSLIHQPHSTQIEDYCCNQSFPMMEHELNNTKESNEKWGFI